MTVIIDDEISDLIQFDDEPANPPAVTPRQMSRAYGLEDDPTSSELQGDDSLGESTTPVRGCPEGEEAIMKSVAKLVLSDEPSPKLMNEAMNVAMDLTAYAPHRLKR